MKRITQLLLLLLCGLLTAAAQDFAPGHQAQGLLESKNVTVDYATGLFHYKVPLYTLKSGEYELPITLDYTSKGVKQDDNAGLYGHNWTLNTGGVVTRTVRGGIPDEERQIGFLWTEDSSTPLYQDVKKVNLHQRDGECDIFTAVFGGRSVNFIIRKDANSKLYAEPLEQTHVRIECLQTTIIEGFDARIDGWIITDESGNRYIYRQKERTENLNKEDAISMNGVRNKSYISAWYPTEIEPLNCNAISYSYLPDSLLTTRHSTSSKVKYNYGKPMEEYPCDFSSYQAEYEAAIRNAQMYASAHNIHNALVDKYEYFEESCAWVISPSFKAALNLYNENLRILGIICDFSNISSASNELISGLTSLADYYSRQNTNEAMWAVTYLNMAKNCVTDCLQEKRQISEKETYNHCSYAIASPILESVSTIDQEVRFTYGMVGTNYRISQIDLWNKDDTYVSGTSLEIPYELLNRVTFNDANGHGFQHIDFDYYDVLSEPKRDPWGYWGVTGEEDVYQGHPDSNNSKYQTLKTITTCDGGVITLDYELNVACPAIPDLTPEQAAVLKIPYGGIRIASIFLQSSVDNQRDTISYVYPIGGTIVYDNIKLVETLDYGNFQDTVSLGQVKIEGAAFLNTGNNGLFYKHVIESVAGKGSTSYLFSTNPRLGETLALDYPFWMNTLPLATAYYDNSGNIKYLKKNIYYTDIVNEGARNGLNRSGTGDFFVASDSVFHYTKTIQQQKQFEYFMDRETIEAQYLAMENVDLAGKIINPYLDIYMKNIDERTYILPTSSSYDLYYGGATLLKEQREYRFEGNVTDSISYQDFFTLGTVPAYKSTEYHYDNLSESLYPTTTVVSSSNGNTQKVAVTRVIDMLNETDAVWNDMKEHNILSPIVKTAELTNNHLMKETVNRYQAADTDGKFYAKPYAIYVYTPEVQIAYNRNGMLFTYPESLYKEVSRLENKPFNQSYVTIETRNVEGLTAYLYDNGGCKVNLKGYDISVDEMAVSDKQPLGTLRGVLDGMIWETASLYKYSPLFWDGYTQMNKNTQGTSYLEYVETPFHRNMMKLMEIVAKRNSDADMDLITSALDSIHTELNVSPEPIYHFVDLYRGIVGNDPNFKMTADEFESLIMAFIPAGADDFKNAYLYDRGRLYVSNPTHTHWDIYLLQQDMGRIFCTIRCSSGEVTELLVPEETSGSLNRCHLDLSSYANVESIEIVLDIDADFGVMVPEGTHFEATSYNKDDTVHAKFNHNGQLEYFEYDAAGRLIKVTDRNGKTILQNQYNILND